MIHESPELERRLLVCLMDIASHTNNRAQKCFLEIDTKCFNNFFNQQIFALIKNSYIKNQDFGFVDILILIPKDKGNLFDNYNWIVEEHRTMFVNNRSMESDIKKLILYKQIREQLILANDLIHMANDCPDINKVNDLVTEHVNAINSLSFHESKDGIYNHELAAKFIDGDLKSNTIIPTTCNILNDELFGGVMTKSYITVAAGAGVGKTSFATYLLEVIARNQTDKQSLFFSLEMESRHIWQKHVGIVAGGLFENLNHDELTSAILRAQEIPIKFYDTAICKAANDIDFIITTSRLKAMEKPLAVIVVDYLGLVQNKGNFERNDLRQSDITGKLANLAMELDCVVIGLSQINRQAAARAKDDQCPYPSDAADSSGSHRSSTLWLGVDRPELYNDDSAYKNQFVVKCRKNRFGDIFDFTLAFNNGTFAEVEQGYFKKPYSKKASAVDAVFSSSYNDN